MDHRWIGPYKIVKDVGKGFYSIQNVDNGKKPARIHGIHLKPYNIPAETPKPDKQDSSNESHQKQEHESNHNGKTWRWTHSLLIYMYYELLY